MGRLIPEERIKGERVNWTLQVPAVLLERLNELESYVNGRSEYAWGTLNVKAVARLALLRGIEALEREREKSRALARSAKGKAEKPDNDVEGGVE